MAQGPQSSLFVIASFGCFVGYLLLVLTPFGGWYSYYYYAGFSAWGTFGGFSAPLGMAICAVLGLPFLGCFLLCVKALRNPASANRTTATQALVLAVTQFSIVAVGAIAFVALVSANDSWWFDAGFYGSAIGSVLAVFCLAAVRGNFPAAAPALAPYAVYAQAPAPPGTYAPPPPPGYAPYAPPGGAPPASYPPPPSPEAPMPQAAPPIPPPPTPQAPPPPSSPARFCGHCGAPMSATHRFCAVCGRPAT